ncbi:hypothetical protein ACFL4Z_02915 [candidate division KSB1 bacterium]
MGNSKSIKMVFTIFLIFSFISQNTLGNTLEKKLKENAKLANEAFTRCDNFLTAWIKHIDPQSSLLPKNLSEGKNIWNTKDSAADNFPFMVITANFTRAEIAGPLQWKALVGEKSLTATKFGLPDDYDFSKQSKINLDLNGLIFGASEYAKDGIVPMVEILGRGIWYDHMLDLVKGIFKSAPVKTRYGNLPSTDSEVNGEMLQILCRLYWATGNEQYLLWAERIGDAYCYEVIPGNYWLPVHHWDFDTYQGDGKFKARDHGCEIVSGLALLYAIEKEKKSNRAVSYYHTIKMMLERIQEIAADRSGLLYNEVDVKSGKITRSDFSDCWGYNYYAYYTFYMATGEKKYRDYVEHVLSNIHNYRDYRWEPRRDGSQSQDGYADSIEGALGLLSHIPVHSAFEWVETEIKRMFAFQQKDGIIEGWHGDGNFARTALMYAFYKTKGLYCKPWRKDLLLSAEKTKNGLEVFVSVEKPWNGKIYFDPPRHSRFLGMPKNYPRINAFPEWFTIDPLTVYIVREKEGNQSNVIGENLIKGYDVELNANSTLRLNIIQKIK